jgi:hypothetical protein
VRETDDKMPERAVGEVGDESLAFILAIVASLRESTAGTANLA